MRKPEREGNNSYVATWINQPLILKDVMAREDVWLHPCLSPSALPADQVKEVAEEFALDLVGGKPARPTAPLTQRHPARIQHKNRYNINK